MNFFFDGIKMGLLLCILLGPIFFTLIQTSVEEGGRAGFIVGAGIWFSDFMYILLGYWGSSYVIDLAELKDFKLYIGTIGGIILLCFGLISLLTAPKIHSFESRPGRTSSIFSLFTKGLLINGINPFTIVFWFGISSFNAGYSILQNMLFFSGILITIITTDILKILLSKKIRQHLKPMHVLGIRKITGVALIIFGVVLFIRVLA